MTPVASVKQTQIEAVRAFNRVTTNAMGTLHAGLVDTPFSLAEARVVFELAQRTSTGISELRATLDIDAGYLTRILDRLAAEGLARRTRSDGDGRRVTISLTPKGRRAFSTLDRRTNEQIFQLLSTIRPEERAELVGSMNTVRRILEAPPNEASGHVVLRTPRSGDYGWVVERHGVLYDREYAWDGTFEALVAQIVAEFVAKRDPARERAWIAELDGERAGCIFCVRKDHATAQLRLLLTEPWARGRGIGTRLVDACIRFARRAGYSRIVLWTNDPLVDARRIYERAGFSLMDEEKHHSFGHDLVGQYWERAL